MVSANDQTKSWRSSNIISAPVHPAATQCIVIGISAKEEIAFACTPLLVIPRSATNAYARERA
jgi:hypothetical protein